MTAPRRGLTLVELLAALGIMSVLAIVASSAALTVVSSARAAEETTETRASMDTFVRLIREDLFIFDDTARRRGQKRFQVEPSSLEIETRSPATGEQVRRMYRFDPLTHTVVAQADGDPPLLLLRDVESCVFEHLEAEKSIVVSLELGDGTRVQLPFEVAQR